MTESFFDRITKNKTAHTPDVLSCLANLSNDEVFTPPEVVNKMLDMLPQELFESPDIPQGAPACHIGRQRRPNLRAFESFDELSGDACASGACHFCIPFCEFGVKVCTFCIP